MKVCTTCNKEVFRDYVEFNCPSCAKDKIIRCDNCRTATRNYSCESCGFSGP
ncbi:MAG: RNA-binding protein [Candidatus Diapherotrites archaeon]|nr:RNA-binding protein [Candidatus Diapherotrites archaeon]